jgi:hypothetical protein
MIYQRFLREFGVANMLVEFIFEAIINATQLQQLVLATPDADPVNPDSFRLRAMSQFMSMLPQHMKPVHKIPLKPHTARLPLQRNTMHSRPTSSRRSWSPLSNHLTISSRPTTPQAFDPKDMKEGDSDEESDKSSRKSNTLTPRMTSNKSSLAEMQKKEQQILHDKYVIAYAVYTEKRKRFGAKLLQRRQKREADFQQMGMSLAMAKLAAYNELLLDEQHKIEDFDILYKPKQRRAGMKNKSKK